MKRRCRRAGRVLLLACALVATILFTTGCLTRAANSRPPSAGEPATTLWIVDHGWHTSIVIRRADIDRARWPELDDFSAATLVEGAWGGREFYMATWPTAWLAMRAAVATSGRVLHIVGLTAAFTDSFAGSESVTIRLSRRGLDALADFVHAEYQRDPASAPLRLGPSLYGSGGFYAGRSRYHLFNTCNTWVARALVAAGLAVDSAGVVTASDVMRQVRALGEARPPG